jgi:hypothetical protein
MIKNPSTRALALAHMGRIMYDMKCPNDMGNFAWAKRELNTLMDLFPGAKPFWVYIEAKWLSKTRMWVVGHRNLSYAG